ncbi:sarcosine oxidase-like protein [Zopfia rhizophila CBS 207.26]|uniref:Sarcosine oxidase-like protein n=1 Tax=Zopfia rhizophila CBS 207.26 TaxID=1314779 RepID=A0A6A6D9T5_9PEZI|nr:sarcosine oxidase-like protein [Zopfia rhizophila CBS 207.26]
MKIPPNSYNIVGAGVFGASAALHIIRKYPHARIRIFDRQPFPCTLAASWDWNKVIRADYTDLLYMRLALEAKELWSNDPLFKPFYHEDGMFWISDTNLAHTVVENYKKLGADNGYALLSGEAAKEAYNGIFHDADYTGVSEVLINRNSGWAEAKEALEETIQSAVNAGVQYIEADVRSLLVRHDHCLGVITTAGKVFSASHTIICTGAGTAKLLANTFPKRKELQVGDRLVAAAICTGVARLNENDCEGFLNTPVCFRAGLMIALGGCLPPTPSNELKFWRDVTFRNTIRHEYGQLISVPDHEQSPSPLMKAEVNMVKKSVYGRRANFIELENYRICWDAVTPDENFIISPHTGCRNLYIATAGSFHGWKFLPILGKYILKMIEAKLESHLVRAWAWDREYPEQPDGDMWPSREMADLM